MRYNKAEMIIRSEHGKGVVVQPTCWGMQGDCAMPEQFSKTYGRRIQEWIDWKDQAPMFESIAQPTTAADQ